MPILVTFFSPSGFEQVKDKGLADFVCYLPLDTRKNAKDFIELTGPRLALFVKYEFWYHYFKTLEKNHIPLFLISAVFREEQLFFRSYGSLFRELLFCVNRVFVQDETSRNLLHAIGYRHVTIAGDTRFDRVVKIASSSARHSLPAIQTFTANRVTIVAGSTWPRDEEAIISAYHTIRDNICWIIAPHQIDQEHIVDLQKRLSPGCITYSQLHEERGATEHDCNVIIIDNIGMLSSLYQFGRIAYIGGGFGSGIHNVLEAAVYGLPVIFGPNFRAYKEARDLIQEGGAFSINKPGELPNVLQPLLSNQDSLRQSGEAAYQYVQRNTGSTALILNYLQSNNLLANL